MVTLLEEIISEQHVLAEQTKNIVPNAIAIHSKRVIQTYIANARQIVGLTKHGNSQDDNSGREGKGILIVLGAN